MDLCFNRFFNVFAFFSMLCSAGVESWGSSYAVSGGFSGAGTFQEPRGVVPVVVRSSVVAAVEGSDAADYLTTAIRDTERQIANQLSRKDPRVPRVLVLGITGSGKTTLLHALAGKALTVKDEGGYSVLEPSSGEALSGFSVGHTISSVTTAPVCWHDAGNQLSYWDCPGFMDTRGSDQEIVNAFALDHLFEAPSFIKNLLVIQESEIMDSRGRGALDRFEKITKLFPISEELFSSVVLVITKVQKSTSPQALLRSMGETDNLLVRFFIENPGNVFSFPFPRTKLGGYDLFADRDRVISQLKAHPVENPRHAVTLDHLSFFHLLGMSKKFDIKEQISVLVESIQRSYRGQELGELRLWESALKRLVDSSDESLNRPDRFIHQAFVVGRMPNKAGLMNFFEPLVSSWRFVGLISKIQQRGASLDGIDLPPLSANLRPLLRGLYEEVNTLVKSKEAAYVVKVMAEALQEELEKKKQESVQKEKEYLMNIQSVEQKSNQQKMLLQREIDEGRVAKGKILEAQRQISQLSMQADEEKRRLEAEFNLLQENIKKSHRSSLLALESQKREISQREEEARRSLGYVKDEVERLRREKSSWDDRIESARREARSGMDVELQSLRRAHAGCDDRIQQAREIGRQEGMRAALGGFAVGGGFPFGGGFGGHPFGGGGGFFMG